MIGGDLQSSVEISIRYRGIFFDALPDKEVTGTGDFEGAYHGSRSDYSAREPTSIVM